MLWGLEQTYTTPYLQELGFPIEYTSMVWLAGPITGFFGQGAIGMLSDKCESKHGRRAPFIFWGAILSGLMALIFSNAKQLGTAGGDKHGERELGMGIAFMSFWMLDFAINAMQCPIKALLVDTCPQNQQVQAYSVLTCSMGLGYVAGYGLGAFDSEAVMPGTDIQNSFFLGVVGLVVFIGFTLLTTKEEAHTLTDEEKSRSFTQEISEHWNTVRTLPEVMKQTFVVQLFTWVAMGVVIIFATDFVGKVVYDGSPVAVEGTDEYVDYYRGVRTGAMGMTLAAAVSAAVAPFLPALMERLSIKRVYRLSQGVMTVSLLGPVLMRSTFSVLLFFGMLGFNMAATQTLPYLITAVSAHETRSRAVYLAIMNGAVCIPMLLVALLGGFIVTAFGSPTVLYLLAALFAATAGVLVSVRLDTSGVDGKVIAAGSAMLPRFFTGDRKSVV